jgi:hypothetical protein
LYHFFLFVVFAPIIATPLRQQVEICTRILAVLRAGSLIMDEVDLILHPLKSELNFPIGRKEPLDLTRNKSAKGLRWEIPIHLLDAVFYAMIGRMSVPLQGSREADVVLKQIKAVWIILLLHGTWSW